jgi:hypothetical protein
MMVTADTTGMPELPRPEVTAVRVELEAAAHHLSAAIDHLPEGAAEHEWVDCITAIGEQVGGLLANLKRERRWWVRER